MKPAESDAQPLADSNPILIVDDEVQNLQLVGEILRREGIPFVFALNGMEALEVINDQPPSLILLDIMMPDLDGFQVCRKIKENPETNEIPIIFLTASTDISNIVSAFSVGGVDYIKKPFIREELLARVSTHLDLHAAKQKLAQLHDYKCDLITTMAHDIKNPVGGIEGLSEMLKLEITEGESIDLEEICSILDLMVQSSKGINELVNQILEDSRNEHVKSLQYYNSPINVSQLLQHLVDLNKLHARKKSITVEFDCACEPSVRISRRTLSGIFDNILNNAVKYSPPGSKVSLRLKESDQFEKGFLVEVEDSAKFITDEQKTTLFEKFTKGGQPDHNKSSSHGIGLSIVKRLVEMHNGLLQIERSDRDCGNIFIVHLPTLVADIQAAPGNHSSTAC